MLIGRTIQTHERAGSPAPVAVAHLVRETPRLTLTGGNPLREGHV